MDTSTRVVTRPPFLVAMVLIGCLGSLLWVGQADATSVGEGAGADVSPFIAAWVRIGGSAQIGYPANDVHQWGPGCNQDYGGGHYGGSAIMQYNCSGDAHAVVGLTWQHLIVNYGGGAVDWYGYPYNDSHRWGNAWVQDFGAGGRYGWNIMIYGDAVGRTQNVRGDIWRYYRDHGGMDGPYGAPTTDEYTSGGLQRQDFQGGSLVWDAVGGTRPYSPIAPREQRFINGARARLGQTVQTASDGTYTAGQSWSGWCDKFVANVAGKPSSGYSSAYAHGQNMTVRSLLHVGDSTIPPGSLVFFKPGPANLYYGHVGVAIGGGQMISATAYGVIASSFSLGGEYWGWAYFNPEWG